MFSTQRQRLNPSLLIDAPNSNKNISWSFANATKNIMLVQISIQSLEKQLWYSNATNTQKLCLVYLVIKDKNIMVIIQRNHVTLTWLFCWKKSYWFTFWSRTEILYQLSNDSTDHLADHGDNGKLSVLQQIF